MTHLPTCLKTPRELLVASQRHPKHGIRMASEGTGVVAASAWSGGGVLEAADGGVGHDAKPGRHWAQPKPFRHFGRPKSGPQMRCQGWTDGGKT